MRLTRVPPSTVVHGIKERNAAKFGVIETLCGRFSKMDAMPLLEGDADEINCAVCVRSHARREREAAERAAARERPPKSLTDVLDRVFK